MGAFRTTYTPGHTDVLVTDPRILLLGPPGAGKGTQSERLAERYGVEHITTGAALRANRDMETEYGSPREFMEAGELVPDPVVDEIVDVALSSTKGFVLDGYPRTVEQAETLAEMTDLDVVFLLEVDREELVRRLTGRRVCPECDASYHVELSPPATEGICDACGAELVQREDDSEETVRERLRVYEENTAPVIERYREADRLIEIDGEGSPDEVFDRLVAAIDG